MFLGWASSAQPHRIDPNFDVVCLVLSVIYFFYTNFKTGLTFWHMWFLEEKKLSPKLSPFGWDTLYMGSRLSKNFGTWKILFYAKFVLVDLANTTWRELCIRSEGNGYLLKLYQYLFSKYHSSTLLSSFCMNPVRSELIESIYLLLWQIYESQYFYEISSWQTCTNKFDLAKQTMLVFKKA